MWSAEADGTVAGRVLEVLAGRGETVATAESLTGGLLAARLTDVPGASRSFVGGVVSYATRVKVSSLGVPPAVVEEHGVISEECAVAMARGARGRLEATWGLSTTGVAGPVGATARLLALSGDRTAIREAACREVLGLLADELAE